ADLLGGGGGRRERRSSHRGHGWATSIVGGGRCPPWSHGRGGDLRERGNAGRQPGSRPAPGRSDRASAGPGGVPGRGGVSGRAGGSGDCSGRDDVPDRRRAARATAATTAQIAANVTNAYAVPTVAP